MRLWRKAFSHCAKKSAAGATTMDKQVVLVLLLAGLGFASASLPLPSYIKPCARSDPNFDECALKSARDIIPVLVKNGGDKKYRVPSINPMEIKEIKIEQGPKQTGLALKISDAKIYGIKDVEIKKTQFDFDKKHAHFEFTAPVAELLGTYDIKGRVLVLPITGEGDLNITIIKPEVTFDVDYELQNRDGKDFVHLLGYNAALVPQKVHFDLTNLFNGDKALGKQMNAFLNENWQDVYKEFSDAVIQAFAEVGYSILQKITHLVSYDDGFPEKL